MVAVAWHAFPPWGAGGACYCASSGQGVEGWRAQFRRFVEKNAAGTAWRIADDGGVRWNSEGPGGPSA